MATRIPALILGLSLAGPAFGHDIARPENDAWFNSLRQPVNGGPCCNQTDCKERRQQTIAGQLHILGDNGKWYAVPESAILHDVDNPYFQAVGCIWNGKVLCFIPARIGG